MTTAHKLCLCTTLLLTLLVAPYARAAGVEAKERMARKECLSGDYAKGVRILSDLFLDTLDPNYIYNQARCFEQNNRCEEASSRFREYLRKAPKITADEKADVEKHIADCQALLGLKTAPEKAATEPKREAASATTMPSAPSSALPTTVVPVPSTQPAASEASPPRASERSVAANDVDLSGAGNAGRGLRLAGMACGAVGLASVGTAIYFYTRARSYSDKVSHEVPPNPSDQSAGKHAQTMQWVFYSAGAAAIAAGTVLYALGWPSTESGHAGVAPMLGPGLAGISAQGAF